MLLGGPAHERKAGGMTTETETRRETGEPWLPGDLEPHQLIDRILRVDHAGEYGARRIYEGQLAVLRRTQSGTAIAHMYEQELRHLKHFEDLMVARRARPTALQPIWHVAGFALGAATALMGERAAMEIGRAHV